MTQASKNSGSNQSRALKGSGNRHSTIGWLAGLASAVLIAGCSMNDQIKGVEVNASFNEIASLKVGDGVTFGGTRIGVVDSITAGDEGHSVVLDLDADKAGIVQSNAAVVIARSTPAEVRVTNPVATAPSVKGGESLRALASPMDEAAYQAGKAFGSIQEALRQAANSFNEFLGSDEWKRTQRDVEESLGDLGRQSEEAARDIGSGVERMMRDLEQHSERTMKDAEKHFGEIQKQLEHYGKDGQKDMIDSINRLLDSLRAALDGASDNKPTAI